MSFPWAEEYKPKGALMRWFVVWLLLLRLVWGSVGGGYPEQCNLFFWW